MNCVYFSLPMLGTVLYVVGYGLYTALSNYYPEPTAPSASCSPTARGRRLNSGVSAPMANPPQKMSLLDASHNAYDVFIFALGALSLPAEGQCERMGDFNTAWALVRSQ